MTLTVEDGTIVENSNTYVDDDDLIAFAAARGITLTGDEEELLIKAMDYIESLYYKGVKYTATQSLQWPRENVYIDGYYVSNTTIPNELKNGQMQCAIAIDQGNDPLQDLERSVKREKVGDLEVEYTDNSATAVINRKIMNSLRKLLTNGGGSVVNVYKG
jgi:ATP phosphoribosyltransferase